MMPRAKRGFKAQHRRNRGLNRRAQGFHSARSRLFAYAKEVVMKAWVYAYAHRKLRKRDFRRPLGSPVSTRPLASTARATHG